MQFRWILRFKRIGALFVKSPGFRLSRSCANGSSRGLRASSPPCIICPRNQTKVASAVKCCASASPITLNQSDDIPACAGCGRCCHLVVELRAGDVVPESLVVEHAGVRCMDQRSDGACMALDLNTRLCTIYEQRPQTCRDFARGSDLCRKILQGSVALRSAGSM